MNQKRTFVTFMSGLVFVVLLFSGGIATAQSDPESPEGQAKAASGGGGEDFYYGDYLEQSELDESSKPSHGGVVPTKHSVVRGDTLWGLSEFYFRNAWDWPKIWGLNPELKDPHKIYPGDTIRLRKDGSVSSLKATPNERLEKASLANRKVASRKRKVSFALQEMAYVETDELEEAAQVIGSVQEKSLLSSGDSIYVSYEDNKIPKVGEIFSVYKKGKSIYRGSSKIGSYVEVYGELKITYVKKGKQARAVIIRSARPIERGMSIGLLKTHFGNVHPVANSKQVKGRIVDLIGPDQLIGASHAVIIDRGKTDGIKLGNRFLVLRSGDAYSFVMSPSSSVGQSDSTYPARAIGEVMIVQVGKKASLGVVSFSIHEFGVGDLVLMRKGK